jgi:hypothetical protein
MTYDDIRISRVANGYIIAPREYGFPNVIQSDNTHIASDIPALLKVVAELMAPKQADPQMPLQV